MSSGAWTPEAVSAETLAELYAVVAARLQVLSWLRNKPPDGGKTPRAKVVSDLLAEQVGVTGPDHICLREIRTNLEQRLAQQLEAVP